jgi:hypothetical protein
MAANSIAFLLSSFWFIVEPTYTYLVATGYIALTLALTAFFFAMERIIPNETYHAFTFLGCFSAFITLLLPPDLYQVIALFIAILALVGIMLFLRYAFRNTTGDVRKTIKLVVFGFLIAWVGFLGRSDFTFYNLGIVLYSIATVLLLVGGVIFGYTLSYSVALDELDWRVNLVDLYVIQQGGLLVYHHSFVDSTKTNQYLTAAGMSGVQSLFQEITSSDEGLNVVSIGSNEILFAHGEEVTCVLVAKEPYQTLLNKVSEFTSQFENIFRPFLSSNSGSLNDFEAANELLEEIFFEQ